MYRGPDGHRRPGLLASLEAELFALRRRPPDLAAALAVACRHAAGLEGAGLEPLHRVGPRLIEAVEAASAGGELAYHNRHHVAEAVLAMGWLSGMARTLGTVTRDEAVLGVLAMVGHDLGHDGSPPGDGVMEARSAASVDALLAQAPALDGWQRAVVHAVIVGTNPARIAENAARAAGDLPPGPLGSSIDLIIAMANEADVFASLLPNLGWHLTRRLVQERRAAGYPHSAELDGPGNRVAFLSCYACLTPSARRLGLAELRDWQVAASERLIGEEEATLDILSEPATDRRFLAAPRRIVVGPA